MNTVLTVIQIISAILLIIVILFQSRGAGVGGLFGGEGNVYRTKRGFEKLLFTFTIILSILFFSSAKAWIAPSRKLYSPAVLWAKVPPRRRCRLQAPVQSPFPRRLPRKEKAHLMPAPT